MGKKKKKNQQSTPVENDDTHHDSNNNSNNKTKIICENSRDIIFPSPILTKQFFIILSLSGYLNATNYNQLLDDIDEKYQKQQQGKYKNNNNNGNADNLYYHNDDDIDDILNTMDIFENNRQSFAISLRTLALHLSSLLLVQTQPRKDVPKEKDANSTLITYNDNEKQMNLIHSIEEATQLLWKEIKSYKDIIYKQHYQLIQCQDLITSYKSSRNNTFEKIKIVNEYKSLFLSLIKEMKYQLNWEDIVLTRLEDILTNENIYSASFVISNNNNNGDDSIDNEERLNPSLYQDFIKWSKMIQSCLLLNEKKWTTVNQSLLIDIIKYYDDGVSLKNNQHEKNYDHEYDKSHVENDNFMNIYTTLNEDIDEQPNTGHYSNTSLDGRQDASNANSIEDAINRFLQKDIFNKKSIQSGNSDDQSLASACIKDQKREHKMANPTELKKLTSRMKIRKNDINDILGVHPLFLLLIGPSNSGKTYLCNCIQDASESSKSAFKGEISSSSFISYSMTNFNIATETQSPFISFIIVLYPRIPSDFLGSIVGSGEDSLLSLFAYGVKVAQRGIKCVILLDGLEQILGEYHTDIINISANRSNETAFIQRMRGAFVNITDQIKCDRSKGGIRRNLLVVCTARSKDDRYIDRFDKVFELGDPDWEERNHIVEQCLDLSMNRFKNNERKMINGISTSLMGKSRGEIALFCREAMNSALRDEKHTDHVSIAEMRLQYLQNSLQNVTPESLKQLSSDASIEMQVLSSNELCRLVETDENGAVPFPLLGINAQHAWKQLRNSIITPLCQCHDLDEILYGNEDTKDFFSKKGITCGVLITGSPGVGKSAIAYHCAAMAARTEPTLRLIDVSCTSLVSKEVGSSEKNISRLFKTARAASPCIILLDGIENIAPVRGNDNTTEGTMDRLLSTLLTEMDGVMSGLDASSTQGIGIIGITHNPATWIDPALLRPGRLEKCIHLDFPDISTRKEIFMREINDINIDFSKVTQFDPKDKDQLSEFIATNTNGKSAAEIIAVSKNARMLAITNAIDQGKDIVELTVHNFTQQMRR